MANTDVTHPVISFPLHVRGMVKLISQEPVGREPDFANVGGFSITQRDGRDVAFDWLMSSGSVDVRDDGKVEIEWYLQDFDTEFFKDSNERDVVPDWSKILKGVIEEIYYEAGIVVNGEEEKILMDVSSFTLEFPMSNRDTFCVEFGEKEIEAYNKRANRTWNKL